MPYPCQVCGCRRTISNGYQRILFVLAVSCWLFYGMHIFEDIDTDSLGQRQEENVTPSVQVLELLEDQTRQRQGGSGWFNW